MTVEPLRKPESYRALDNISLSAYLTGVAGCTAILGGKPTDWDVKEVGDGNLNLVFIVKGTSGSLVVKQALPYVRMVGDSWPLPLSRSYFERLALQEQAKHVPHLVPKIYHYDDEMALIVMEYLSPHIIMRKGLIARTAYPQAAVHLAEFLAQTLFKTSDLYLPAAEKKHRMAIFCDNTAMCKITEDLVFTEPYFSAPMNRHTSPQLDDIAEEFKKDTKLKRAAQELKHKFLTQAEALLHGDLHTGSVMVTERETKAIDPEFAFYGPMGFDVGAVIANLLLSYFSQDGHDAKPDDRESYKKWLLEQVETLWLQFESRFTKLWLERSEANPGGDSFAPVLFDKIETEIIATAFLRKVWEDTLGFAGMKIIRRILGLAHVEDMESIKDAGVRAACEKQALTLGRRIAVERSKISTVTELVKIVSEMK